LQEFSLLSYGTQSLVAYCIPIGLLLGLEGLTKPQDTLKAQGLEYIFLAVLAAGLALAVSSFSIGSAREGRFVWVIPAILMAIFLTWQVVSEGAGSVWHSVFISQPGHGEDAWISVVLTLPTWSCGWYAAVMWRRRRAVRMRSSS